MIGECSLAIELTVEAVGFDGKSTISKVIFYTFWRFLDNLNN